MNVQGKGDERYHMGTGDKEVAKYRVQGFNRYRVQEIKRYIVRGTGNELTKLQAH